MDYRVNVSKKVSVNFIGTLAYYQVSTLFRSVAQPG